MIEFATLGRCAVFRNGIPLALPAESPGFLLLVVLAVDGPRSTVRLADLLWPDHPPEERAAELSRVVARLETILGRGVIREENGRLEVDSGRVSTDVERFREAIAGRRASDALSLYRGPFLEELDASLFPQVEEWVEEMRRSLAEMARWAREYEPWEAEVGGTRYEGFFRKLRSRKIVQVGLLYVGFAVGSLELSNVLVERGVLPHTAFLILLALHFVGLPLAVGATWVIGGAAGEAVGAGGSRGLRAGLARTRLRSVHLIGLFAVLAAGSGAGWLVLQQAGNGIPEAAWAALPDQKRIAVIPFVAVGEDQRGADFARGLAANLSDRLSQFEGLRGTLSVIPQVEIRVGDVTAPSQAYQQFGANLVITGILRVRGDSIWVEAELVDAERVELRRRWVMDQPLSDPGAIQHGILAAFHDLLDVQLEDWEREALAVGGTLVPEAYTDQVRAAGHLHRFERLEDVEEAVRLFRRALDRDPRYLLALAGLGKAHLRRYELVQDPGELERGREAVERALELDDRLGMTHLTLGLIRVRTGDHAGAVDAFERALELEPYSAEALIALGETWAELDEPERAEATLRRAVELDPHLWSGYNALGAFYNRTGRHEKALEQFAKVLEVTPDNARGWTNLGAAHFFLSQFDEAEEALRRSVEIVPTSDGFSNLATLYYYLERFEDAARIYEEALALNDRNYALWANLAATWRRIPGREAQTLESKRRVVETAEAALRVNPRNPEAMLYLAEAYASLDEFGRVRSLLADAVEVAGAQFSLLYQIGALYERIGDREEAIRWIGEAMRSGFPEHMLEQDDELRELRADPRMQAQLEG